ncbi:carbohydrate ABC transporter permease [Bacillus sp. SG-1]|uniref:carbohydrate ABC transporter permease n=1 Tax=Bacillus sp. SG-1 TaxID=161544 RepID=UPI00015437A0|nr:carbohydrate ABC transporter permease [Bacillus sp. SG-1]EDL66557.1 probable sugar ABC transporter, permease protein [Bacillus sp. SG-1]
MKTNKCFRLIQYIFGIIVVFFTLAPYVWLFISSVSFQKDLTTVPLRWIQPDLTFSRYIEIFTNPDNPVAYTFKQAMGNSIIIGISCMTISLVVGSLAAYAVARLTFPFQKYLVFMFLFTYMIPPVVIVIPLYLLFSQLGWLDSKGTLILLNLTFIIPFTIWVMQSYFKSFSKEMEEAAFIDGCSRLQALWYVVIPIIRPGLMATAILSFLLSWEEFFYSLLFTSSLEAKTISVAIAEFSGKNAVDYGMIATGGILATLPPLIIIILFQKHLVTGMTAGGVKE